MPGGNRHMRKLRDQPTNEIEGHEARSPNDVLDARPKQKQVNHVARQVEETFMHEKRAEICPPMRLGRDKPEVANHPFDDCRTFGQFKDQRNQINQHADPHQCESDYWITPGLIINPDWQQEKHCKLGLVCAGEAAMSIIFCRQIARLAGTLLIHRKSFSLGDRTRKTAGPLGAAALIRESAFLRVLWGSKTLPGIMPIGGGCLQSRPAPSRGGRSWIHHPAPE